jgi:hypothetical protein
MGGFLIGDRPALTPIVDKFNGDNSTVEFTLSQSSSTNAAIVFISGFGQLPIGAYSISGVTLTFTSAPPTGTENIWVTYNNPLATTVNVSDGAIGSDQLAAADAITEAKIAADAVTLAKMAAGTAGTLITYDAAGDPAAVATGTAGQVLTSGGPGVAPTMQDVAAGGSLVLIGTSEASASASLTITGLDTTYDTYMVVMSGMQAASNGVYPAIRLGDSGGIDSGGSDYSWAIDGLSTNYATPSGTISTADSYIRGTLDFGGAVNGQTNGANDGWGAVLYITEPQNSAVYSRIYGNYVVTREGAGGANKVGGGSIFGQREANIAHDRIQFYFSSGNITLGRMTVWGITHA